MSKWVNAFENHAFNSSWELVKEELSKIDETELTDDNQIMELARAKKVILFIDNYLKIVEPDLNIANITQNLNHINSYCTNLKNEIVNFASSKNLTYIRNVNGHLDNILGQVRALNTPLPKLSSKSISSILKQYTETFETALKEIDLNSTIKNSIEIRQLKTELLVDEDTKSISSQIKEAHEDIENKHNEIQDFYNETLNEQGYDNTLIEVVKKAKEEIVESNKSAKDELTELKAKIENFEEYYTKIFGELNDDEVRVGGLKKEIEVQKEKLNTFEQEQQEKHNKILEGKIHELNEYENKAKETYDNIHKRIEEHLPGATSAGLAEAYHNERKNFEKPIKDWNKLFITSLGLMFITTLLTFITFSSSEIGWSLSFSHAGGIEETMNNIFFKLPLFAPLIWLAIFASKRRSENQRLEQEYAHKEALARSYSSYKQQIEGLNQEDEALLKKLLDSSIETVSKNASDTLDKKHGDGTPSKEVLEKFGEIVKTVTGKK